MLSRRGLVADPAPPGSDLPAKARLRQQAIQDWMSSFADRASLLAELEAAGVAWAELRDSADVFAGGAHSVPVPGTDSRVAAMPYEFSGSTVPLRRAVASRGEHNAETLADWLGLDETAIASLTDRGVLITG